MDTNKEMILLNKKPKLFDFQMITQYKPISHPNDRVEEIKGFLVFFQGKQVLRKTWKTGKIFEFYKSLENEEDTKTYESSVIVYSNDDEFFPRSEYVLLDFEK